MVEGGWVEADTQDDDVNRSKFVYNMACMWAMAISPPSDVGYVLSKYWYDSDIMGIWIYKLWVLDNIRPNTRAKCFHRRHIWPRSVRYLLRVPGQPKSHNRERPSVRQLLVVYMRTGNANCDGELKTS